MGQCNEVHLFSNIPSRSASVVFDGVLGSSTHLTVSMHTSEVPEATHEPMLRALEGRAVSLKRPSRVRDLDE